MSVCTFPSFKPVQLYNKWSVCESVRAFEACQKRSSLFDLLIPIAYIVHLDPHLIDLSSSECNELCLILILETTGNGPLTIISSLSL